MIEPRGYEIRKGDIIYLSAQSPYMIGAKPVVNHRFYFAGVSGVVTKIIYWRKPWWKFWKKKEIKGIMLQWIENEHNSAAGR